MSVNKALYNILEGKLDDMRSNFSSALSTKAVEKLEERKIDIAQKYFGQMQEENAQNSGAAMMKNPTQRPYNSKSSPSGGYYDVMNQAISIGNQSPRNPNAQKIKNSALATGASLKKAQDVKKNAEANLLQMKKK